MIVAQLRGYEFILDGRYYTAPSGTGTVLEEIAEWLGFNAYRQYLNALPRLRKNIFKRAKD